MDPPLAAPDLPTRFPCWCRAIYSWGGEQKRDLGFVEGDLIECLNAGDGSWWMGRLRRDKRMAGMFPSNFVVVLDEDFRPASRASSPFPRRSPSPNPFNPQASQTSKSKPFRKPFQAYAAPDPGAQKRAELRKQESVPIPRTPSPSSTPRQRNTRRQSPPRFVGYTGSRGPSPNPYATRMGAHSPDCPPSPSGIFSDEAEHGSPPPPPPPHRTNFRAETSTGFHEHRDRYSHNFHRPQSLTPDQHTPERLGHTPSPLTHAMNDIISSLEDMGMPENSALSQNEITSHQNNDPWSPEEFGQGYGINKLSTPMRPNTSTGEYEHSKVRPNHWRSRTDFSEEPPQLSNYVERMESRLGRTKRGETPRPSDQGYNEDEEAPGVPPKAGFFRSKSPFGRPKSPFGRPKSPFGRPKSPFGRPKSPFTRSNSPPPMPPPPRPRPKSSVGDHDATPVLRHRKSAYEVGKAIIGRTFTTKSSSTVASSGQQSTTTNGTVSTQATDRSLMSGHSAGAFSATSAGSYARRQTEKYGRARSAMGLRMDEFSRKNGSQPEFDGSRPETPFTGVTYHSSHASGEQPRAKSSAGWRNDGPEMPSLGGLVTPKGKKSGFFKRMVESAKTGAANARSSIAIGEFVKPNVPPKGAMPDGVSAIAGGFGFGTQYSSAKEAARDMGLGSNTAIDWVQVRRDVNRSNSLSRNERAERKERCQMMDFIAIEPVKELADATDGDEGGDGCSILEPTNFQSTSLSLVDKNARFITSLPPITNPISLATGFVCRPYRTDVQRLRAIFTWCAEKIVWEDDFEGDVDTKRVVQTRRGGTEEIVFLVLEMCQAVGIRCNVIRGYLKPLGEVLEAGRIPHPNHFWNSVLIDNEWRIMDCSLASPHHPKRNSYSSASSDKAEGWYFLTRPIEICWTHVPVHNEDQHLIPTVMPEILLALPCACPPFFKNTLEMVGYDTSITRIEDLELVHVKISVPADVECAAEVEALSLSHDLDGDAYETDNIARMPALSQASWTGGQKQYTVKALLPPNSGSQAILKIYAGKRGLMQNIKSIPYPLAVALPVVHEGDGCNGYEFFTRYPTPHATRHDLYVIQPQCKRLVVGNTFVFAVRQHPSAAQLTEEAISDVSGSNRDSARSPIPGLEGSRAGNRSPLPLIRPTSALSMTNSNSASGAGPNLSIPGIKQFKSAKLAIQAPGGKILRLQRKEERMGSGGGARDGVVELPPDGSVYETIIKCGEKGTWRGLVLADRSARWCVFAEWNCV